MSLTIEVLLSPAEYQARAVPGFAGSVCVVFDVLRATSVMITGLANGAAGFVPVAEISEAVARRRLNPQILLGGERDGLRITAQQTGSVPFDFGNSPREYTAARVKGRSIVTTTTNGTRAIQACAGAEAVLVGSFLNLSPTADWIRRRTLQKLVLVCAGTGQAMAYEDVLCAGALCDQVSRLKPDCHLDDAAILALRGYREVADDLEVAVGSSKNGRRLLANSELRDDVVFCARRDVFDLVAGRETAEAIQRLSR